MRRLAAAVALAVALSSSGAGANRWDTLRLEDQLRAARWEASRSRSGNSDVPERTGAYEHRLADLERRVARLECRVPLACESTP